MITINASNWTVEQRRKLLDDQGGRVFHASFVKKDGSIREMQCKRWTEKHFTYGSANAQDNTCAHKPELYTVSDIGAADAFRNLNLNTLISVRASGKVYSFR